ncbi:MbtH family protein [Streptomyces sp. NPDC001076]
MRPEGTGIHLVVRNDKLQYSLWPADREVPAGRRPAGFRGDREPCLDRVEQVWTDMRPLSARSPRSAAAPNRSRPPRGGSWSRR